MAIIGFVLALLMSIYVTLAGASLIILEGGFSGKTSIISWVVMIMGLVGIIGIFLNAPFTITMNTL